jgi:hypothetical protein
LFLVLRDAVGIVDVTAGQKTQHMGGGRLDHGAELAFSEGLVAGEVDLPYRSLCSLRDGVDEVNPAVAAVDDLRIDADLGTAGTAVCLDDAADVGLHGGALQRSARLRLDSRGKVGILDLLVAFECDAVEHGRFGYMHHKPLADTLDGNLFEQARRNQRFQRRVARGVVEMPVGRCMKMRADGLGIDAAVAFDDDRSLRWRRGFGGDGCCENQAEDAGKPKSGQPRSGRSAVLRDASNLSDPHVPRGSY